MAFKASLENLIKDKIKGEVVSTAIQSSSSTMAVLERTESNQSTESKYKLHLISWMGLIAERSKPGETQHSMFSCVFTNASNELVRIDTKPSDTTKMDFSADGSFLALLVDGQIFISQIPSYSGLVFTSFQPRLIVFQVALNTQRTARFDTFKWNPIIGNVITILERASSRLFVLNLKLSNNEITMDCLENPCYNISISRGPNTTIEDIAYVEEKPENAQCWFSLYFLTSFGAIHCVGPFFFPDYLYSEDLINKLKSNCRRLHSAEKKSQSAHTFNNVYATQFISSLKPCGISGSGNYKISQEDYKTFRQMTPPPFVGSNIKIFAHEQNKLISGVHRLLVYRSDKYNIFILFDYNGDFKILVSTSSLLGLVSDVVSPEGLVEIGAVLFSTLKDRQAGSSQFPTAASKLLSGKFICCKDDETLYVSVAGKAVYSVSLEWLPNDLQILEGLTENTQIEPSLNNMLSSLKKASRLEYTIDQKEASNNTIESIQPLSSKFLLVFTSKAGTRLPVILERVSTPSNLFEQSDRSTYLQSIEVDKVLQHKIKEPTDKNKTNNSNKIFEDLNYNIESLKKAHAKLVKVMENTNLSLTEKATELTEVEKEICSYKNEVEKIIGRIKKNQEASESHLKSEIYSLLQVQEDNQNSKQNIIPRMIKLNTRCKAADDKLKEIIKRLGVRDANPELQNQIELRVNEYDRDSEELRSIINTVPKEVSTLKERFLDEAIVKLKNNGLTEYHLNRIQQMFLQNATKLEQRLKQLNGESRSSLLVYSNPFQS